MQELGSVRQEARATFQRALVKYHLGEIDEAEALGLRALELLERTGEPFFQVQTLRTLGLCAAARSDLVLAEERLRAAVALAVQIGGALLTDLYRHLVEALIRQGRPDDARELGQLALRDLPAEDLYARASGLLIEASLATSDGRAEEARGSFEEALRLLEQQGLPLDLGEARLSYGRALRRLGDEAGAAAELAPTREEMARLGANGLVREIDRELAEIEGAGLAGPLPSP